MKRRTEKPWDRAAALCDPVGMMSLCFCSSLEDANTKRDPLCINYKLSVARMQQSSLPALINAWLWWAQ